MSCKNRGSEKNQTKVYSKFEQLCSNGDTLGFYNYLYDIRDNSLPMTDFSDRIEEVGRYSNFPIGFLSNPKDSMLIKLGVDSLTYKRKISDVYIALFKRHGPFYKYDDSDNILYVKKLYLKKYLCDDIDLNHFMILLDSNHIGMKSLEELGY